MTRYQGRKKVSDFNLISYKVLLSPFTLSFVTFRISLGERVEAESKTEIKARGPLGSREMSFKMRSVQLVLFLYLIKQLKL